MSEHFPTMRFSSASGGVSNNYTPVAPAALENAPAAIWANVLRGLRQRIEELAFTNWIVGLQYVAEVNGEILISAPGELERDRVSTAYGHLIKQAWLAADPRRRELKIEARNLISEDILCLAAPAEDDASGARMAATSASTDGIARPDRIQTLDNYVSGDSNCIAYNVARRVAADDPDLSGQVVTFIGPHGVGKSHLLRGIEASFDARNRSEDVLYVSAEDFMVAFIEGVKRKDTSELRTMMRSAKVVLMDDFQFICTKPGTLVEFFAHLRANVAKGRIVVIACDQPVASIEQLDDRMRDEIMGGVSAALDLPDRALRLEIVRAIAGAYAEKDPRFALPDEWATLLAERTVASGRVLSGVISSVYFKTVSAGRPLTWDVIEREIALKVGAQASPRPPKIETIKDVTAKLYNISRQDLESQCRKRTFSLPRQYAMYLSRKLTNCSYPMIGRMFGGRDHTTVLFAYRKLSRMVEKNGLLAEEMRRLESQILSDPRNQR